MPYWTPDRLQKLIEIAGRISFLDGPTPKSDQVQAAIAADKRTLRDLMVPETAFLVMKHDSAGERLPIVWAPIEDELWEFLEHAAGLELLGVYEITQEGGEAKDITVDFCARWLDAVADYTLDADEFYAKLPEFVAGNFGAGAMALWNAAHQRRG